MEVFKALKKFFFRNSGISTSHELLEFLLRGGNNKSKAGQDVTPSTAMTVSAVYASIKVLAETIGLLPIHLMEKVETDAGEGSERATKSPLYSIMMERPNTWQTPYEFKEMMIYHLLLQGNFFAMIIRRGAEPRQLVPVMPHNVRITVNDNRRLTYHVRAKEGGEEKEISPFGMFHLRNHTIDGIRGVTPLTWARETIGGALATQSHAATFFGNGAFPSGVLTHPKQLDPEAAETLKESWEEFLTGDRANSTAILEEGIEYKPIALNAQDSQYLETRQFQRSEIAAIFRVPPHKIGDLSRATFSNIEHQETSFYTNSIAPLCVRIEQTLGRDLLAGGLTHPTLFYKCGMGALLRGDTKTRGEFYVKMVNNGIFSRNEVRRLEDLNPVEGGDEFMTPLNMGGTNDNGNQDNEDEENPANQEPDGENSQE